MKYAFRFDSTAGTPAICCWEAFSCLATVSIVTPSGNPRAISLSGPWYESAIELSKHPNIIGIKEASGNLEQAMRIVTGTEDDFLLISGDDILTGPLLSLGGKGVISVLANAFPKIFSKIKQGWLRNDYDTVSNQLYKLLNINPLMYAEGSPVGIKEVLNQMGICDNTVRLPHARASEKLQKHISEALKSL